jgi:hypothetical protein
MEKLTRRCFLGASVAAVLFPSLKLKEVEEIDWTLKFSYEHNEDYFCPDRLIVSKGPYECECGYTSGQDLRDCHGLCATREWAWCICEQLEYSHESMMKIYRLPWDGSEKRKIALESLRRIKLTKQEKQEIYNVCKKLRGEHHCAEQDYRMVT